MKKTRLLVPMLLLLFSTVMAQTPLSQNGRLKLVGKQLSNECGSPVQLRGLSTHGVMFHQNCYKESAVKSIAEDWNASVLRLAIYTQDVGGTAGYIKGDKDFWDNWIDLMVGYAKDNGIYVIIDWHILDDGNPNQYVNEAKTFFTKMSNKYKNEKHVIYEICNEPNGGGDWNQVKSYANQIIPAIRNNDPEGIIIVGTPGWSSDLWAAANDKLPSNISHNVMYSFHFYANSHYDYDKLRQTAGEIPIFISEWGSVDASGNGGFNSGSSDNWMSIADGNNNGGVKISSCNWAFVDKNEAASALQTGACDNNDWTKRTSTSGNYIYNYLHKAPAFTACNSAGDDDGDGVSNGDDLCKNTPSNTFVGADGCPALQGDADFDGVIDAKDICANTPAHSEVNQYGCAIENSFVSNVCEGFNNKYGYAYTTFSTDTLENIDIWNRPGKNNDVYTATVGGGTLNIDVKNSDPDFITQGISFGEIYRFNGTSYDTTLVPMDIRGNAILKFDVHFQGQGYGSNEVWFDVQLEDANGEVITSSATGNLFREKLTLNTWHEMEFDFTNGVRESWDAQTCQDYGVSKVEGKPCYIPEFDFSKVSKVLMWVNPGAGEDWSIQEAFNGTWKIDNLSLGYTGKPADCVAFRDEDGDGIRVEKDKCKNTAPGETVDSKGCSAAQLDQDKDGVSNLYDLCPSTPTGETVDFKGCAAFEADDDNDGVTNDKDDCLETPEGDEVDTKGCTIPMDDDNDGVVNANDECPNTPSGKTVNNVGCAASELDDDNDAVMNDKDQCPSTPSGKSVNSEGCAQIELDDDNDGVMNDKDACPTTPANEDVNLVGCAPSELDDDNDGVMNNSDDCPETVANAEVDQFGCEVLLGVSAKYSKVLKVYPLPASSILNVEQVGSTFTSATITTLSGKVILTAKLTGTSTQIDVSKIANGNYILNVSGVSANENLKITIK